MTDVNPKLSCVEMMDKKVAPLWNKKLDKWIFIPTVSLLIILLGIVFTIAVAKPSSEQYEDLKEDVKKYEGMELRIYERMDLMQDKLINKIDEVK